MTIQEAPVVGLSGPAAQVAATWQDVCRIDDLTPERGAAALVDGHPVALFRLDDDEVLAIDDVDPFWGVAVLSRGLVGCLGGLDTVASPLLKQRFDLRTGVCIDDTAVSVPTWPVRVHLGRVEVAQVPSCASP